MKPNRRIVLASMPWASPYAPSLQTGILGSVVSRAGFDAYPRSFFLDFLDAMISRSGGTSDIPQLDASDYQAIMVNFSETGVGDWIFTTSAFAKDALPPAADYFAFLVNGGLRAVDCDVFNALRGLVPQFIEACALEIAAIDPLIVGFTTTFNQNVPSLALARRVKELLPQTTIVFGGANVEDRMGHALHRSFPYVDVVLQGEAELTFEALLHAVYERRPLDAIAGLAFRRDGTQVVTERTSAKLVTMDHVPIPNFDEYFDRLRQMANRGAIDNRIHLPVESSRGCWWGAKSHCTFCGLNGNTMAFRGKDATAFGDEVLALSRRHGRVRFEAVDNIIDMSFFETFLPRMARVREDGTDLVFFYETKANLKKHHVKAFADAGVTSIQPGIETLSTSILKLMRKGVTAWQNIRLLKWCREYRVEVRWNWLFGFPGEEPNEYEKMIDLVPSISHLKPPGTGQVRVQRFSPYFDHPEAYGIRLTGPDPAFRFIYPVDAEALVDLSYTHEFEFVEPHDLSYVARLGETVTGWSDGYDKRSPQLTMERGRGFVRIRDRRLGLSWRDMTFEGAAAAVYLACDAGAARRELEIVYRRFEPTSPAPAVALDAFLQELVDLRLVFRENDLYLSLAVSMHPVVSYETYLHPRVIEPHAIAVNA